MATGRSMDDILGSLRYENIPLIGQAQPVDDVCEVCVVDADEPDDEQIFKVTRSNLMPDIDEETTRGSTKGTLGLGEPYSSESVFGALQPMHSIRRIRRISVKQPTEIERLQQILSSEYGDPVEITSIDELPTTRKSVKRIHFVKGHEEWLRQVWVFRADPIGTAREMAVYEIASGAGVPTGKPIGYHPKPSDRSYPYDIAIIGGIVEHAGDSYNELINNLRLSPERMSSAAMAVARMIADSQVRLNSARPVFGEYGIELKPDTPAAELKARLLPALNIPEQQAAGLVEACERLYARQQGGPAISHGDLHTGNIVTKELEQATSMAKFGLIDWGTICLDSPYGDLTDFLLHHMRQAGKANPDYSIALHSPFIQAAFQEQFRQSSARQGLEYAFFPNDKLIQSALWNIYEMYDPVRKDKIDILEKAAYHMGQLQADLKELSSHGYREEAHQLRKELGALLPKYGFN